jgi:hypothetical protein
MPKLYITNSTGQHRHLHYSQLATDQFKAANPAAANRGPATVTVPPDSTVEVEALDGELKSLIDHNAQYGLTDGAKAPKGFRGLTYSSTDPSKKDEPKPEAKAEPKDAAKPDKSK